MIKNNDYFAKVVKMDKFYSSVKSRLLVAEVIARIQVIPLYNLYIQIKQ